ncbi:MAG: restriction endonuclease subunit S [Bacteroidetes bacterium]|nr:MAG: restriction endonuclease subunit S [Bacteroidota bacterium]
MSWRQIKIQEFADVVGGGTPSTRVKEYWGGNIPWIGPKDLSKYDFRFIKNGERNITKKGLSDSSAKLLPINTVMMTSRAPIGYLALAENEICTNQGFQNLICKEGIASPFFVYYLLANNLDKIKSIATGATFPEISKTKLKGIALPLPPLQTQKRIADILIAYDDLIENNLKRIKLLEQTTQNIYKEWFVNMRFPGHENITINQETGLPEGWNYGVVSEFGTVITGKTPSTKKVEYYGNEVPFVKTPDMHSSPYVIDTFTSLSTLGAESQKNKFLPKDSVMVSCIGTAGVVALVSRPSQTNQQINSVTFDGNYKSFYFYCFSKELKPLLEGLGSNGATMVNVNKGKFEGIKILIPIADVLISFDNIVKTNFNQILNLLNQNQKLKEAQDILLPRLMNQTIEV